MLKISLKRKMKKVRTKQDSSAFNVMDGEATVIHTGTSAYFSLNKTGTVLWEHLSKEAYSKDQLLRLLADIFDFGKDNVLSDIEIFITKLKEADLVIEIDEGSAEVNKQRLDIDSSDLGAYEAPDLVKFGDLETLMLSGE